MPDSDPSLLTPGLGESAQVAMQLLLEDRELEIAQLGPDFLILRQPAQLPPATAEIVLQVDGSERRWPVRLPHGASPEKPEVALAAAE